MSTFILKISSKTINRSLSCESRVGLKIGSLNSDGPFIYDGCLGRIQANKSDYFFGRITQPVFGQNLSLTGVFSDSDHSIISTYKPSQVITKNT